MPLKIAHREGAALAERAEQGRMFIELNTQMRDHPTLTIETAADERLRGPRQTLGSTVAPDDCTSYDSGRAY